MLRISQLSILNSQLSILTSLLKIHHPKNPKAHPNTLWMTSSTSAKPFLKNHWSNSIPIEMPIPTKTACQPLSFRKARPKAKPMGTNTTTFMITSGNNSDLSCPPTLTHPQPPSNKLKPPLVYMRFTYVLFSKIQQKPRLKQSGKAFCKLNEIDLL